MASPGGPLVRSPGLVPSIPQAEDSWLSHSGPTSLVNEDGQLDALGVITALERTCFLESALRQAIQDTHPLTTTLDWDFHAADRERQALLAITCVLIWDA